MNELNKVIGNYGEDLALSYLISHNHKLIKRNYKKKWWNRHNYNF